LADAYNLDVWILGSGSGPGVVLGATRRIGPGVVLRATRRIGPGVVLRATRRIGPGVVLRATRRIRPGVVLRLTTWILWEVMCGFGWGGGGGRTSGKSCRPLALSPCQFLKS
jgi:hypothetical protein